MENANNKIELQIRERAFNRRIHRFAIVNLDIQIFSNESYLIYESEINRILNEFIIVKSMAVLVAEFEKKNYKCE